MSPLEIYYYTLDTGLEMFIYNLRAMKRLSDLSKSKCLLLDSLLHHHLCAWQFQFCIWMTAVRHCSVTQNLAVRYTSSYANCFWDLPTLYWGLCMRDPVPGRCPISASQCTVRGGQADACPVQHKMGEKGSHGPACGPFITFTSSPADASHSPQFQLNHLLYSANTEPSLSSESSVISKWHPRWWSWLQCQPSLAQLHVETSPLLLPIPKPRVDSTVSDGELSY